MKRRKRYAKAVIGLALLIVLGITQAAGTYAWNVHKADQENNLQSKNSSVQIVENFPDRTVTPGGTKTKEVSFKNTGTASVFLRVAFTESWETADALLEGDTNVTKNWTPAWTRDWVQKDDWYYYKKVLPAGASTEKILSGVTFPPTVEAGASYQLSFLAEVVQVSDEDPVNTAATTEVFGREATVTGKTISNGTVTAGTVVWN